MHYTVQLGFCPKDLLALQSIFSEANSPLVKRGDRPHLSLSVFDAFDHEWLDEKMQQLASEFDPIQIQFASVGRFPSPDNVVFLAPVVTESILAINRRLFELFATGNVESDIRYTPGHWVPHVTFSIGEKADCTQLLLDEKRLWDSFKASTLELISFPPGRLVSRFNLDKSNRS